jgi:SAM-dependent methyltransferase
MGEVRLRELLVGVEGLALLRGLYDGTTGDADARLAEVRRVLDDDRFVVGEPTREASPREGYAAWADSYDHPGNPIVALEEPAVRARLGEVPPGRTLDAACGTGRHARWLVERGHDVVGFDASPEMLARARRRAPGAEFVPGYLVAVPADDATFDAAICGLAIAHLPSLVAPVAELARVLRPGGRLVVSVLHPFLALLGWHAPFADSDGRRGFVREHAHTHGDYLAAFGAAGLIVRDCAEPRLAAADVAAKRRAFRAVPEATVAAYAGLPAVLVWALTKPGTPQ